MTIKQRMAVIEKAIKPPPPPCGKTWLVESPNIDAQVEKIRAGKVKHPDNGEKYDLKDAFFLLNFVDTRKIYQEEQSEIRALEEEKERLLKEIAAAEKKND